MKAVSGGISGGYVSMDASAVWDMVVITHELGKL